jgi:hypothetical protein
MWIKAHSVPNSPIQLVEETQVSLKKEKTSVLEVGASSTLFPCENCVSF